MNRTKMPRLLNGSKGREGREGGREGEREGEILRERWDFVVVMWHQSQFIESRNKTIVTCF